MTILRRHARSLGFLGGLGFAAMSAAARLCVPGSHRDQFPTEQGSRSH